MPRRHVLAGALAAAASVAQGDGGDSSSRSGPWRRIRRIVTSEDAQGRAVVLFDGEPANELELNGTRIVRIWETPATPAELPITVDAGATAGNAYREGFRGTSFYVAELPGGRRAPQIPMHKNATLDYLAVLSGRIVLALPEREIELRAGDVIVQGGNDHTWINRWREPCVLLFVVVAGAPAPARG